MALHVKPGTEWSPVLDRVTQRAPEAFGSDVLHNLIDRLLAADRHA